MPNPYLQDQQNAISNTVNTSLNQQQMPGIRRAAIAAGGYGGSRTGIAQGLAMNGANTAIANATANLQGQAYEGDQNRSLQQSMQNAQLGAQERIAGMQDATNRYGLGNQYSLGMGNLGLGFQNSDNQYSLGMGNLALGNRQADQGYNLGMGSLANQQQQTSNQYSLGQGQLQNQATANNQQYGLGLGNLGLGFQNSNNQYALGNRSADTNQYQAQTSRDNSQGQLSLGNRQADQNYGLGLGGLNLGYQNSNNQFNLGQQAANTNQYQAQTGRDLGFGQLGNQQQANNQGFYTQQRGQDLQQQGQGFNQSLQALQAQLGIGGQISGIGQQQFNAPGNVLGQYGNMLSPFTGLNNTQSTTSPQSGGGLAGAIGGGLTAYQLWQLLNKGP